MSSLSDIQASVSQLKSVITDLVARINDIKTNQADAIAANKKVEQLTARLTKLEADKVDTAQIDAVVTDLRDIKTLLQSV